MSLQARPGAILDLTWDQVDLDRKLIKFLKSGERQTSKRRPTVPITDTLAGLLRSLKTKARTDHVIEFRGRPVRNIYSGVKVAAQQAGIKGVSPYVLRHTSGTWMAMQGVDLLEIAERMGHTKIETTRKHYLHLMPDHQKASTAALDVRPAGLQIDVMAAAEVNRRLDIWVSDRAYPLAGQPFEFAYQSIACS